MPPPGWKILTVRESTYRELVVQAGKLQARRGETVSLSQLVEEMIGRWRGSNENGDGDLDDGS